MSYGLVSQGGNIVPLKKIECIADVTDDFGIFTLKQQYSNETDDVLNVEYIFPIADSVVVTDFYATINEKVFFSELMEKQQAFKVYENSDTAALLLKHNTGSFRAKLGGINPGDDVTVEIKYIRRTVHEHERTRIIIPTVVAPRYITFGSQIALESMIGVAEYKVSLDMTYKNCNITNVLSPTHDITTNFSDKGVNVRLKNEVYADRDIVIDVYTLDLAKPKMFCFDNIVCCTFTPEIDIYERQNRNYLFMLDISSSMNGEKISQAKNALLICLRSLQKGDKFNIVVFETQNSSFSDEFLPVNDDTLKVATTWINHLETSGGTELFRPIIDAYKYANEAVALLFTDGQITGSDDILSYVKVHSGVTFYTFGIDSAVNESFLTQLSSITGGKARFITPSERIDNTIINAFSTISAPCVNNAIISFDVPVKEITPRVIRRIHCGEKLCVMAECIGDLPKKLTLKGQLISTDTVITVPFDEVIIAGKSLRYLYAKQQIDNLISQFEYDGSVKDNILKKQIIELSIKNNVHCKFTAFVLTNGKTNEKQAVDVNVPILLPYGWYQSGNSVLRDSGGFTKTDEHFMELAKKQRANGSFIQSSQRKKEDVALYTAEILYEFSSQCPNVEMYIWQLRKTAGFLLNYIENSEYGIIPPQIVKALSMWHSALGGNDEISQKAAVLEFLHRGK